MVQVLRYRAEYTLSSDITHKFDIHRIMLPQKRDLVHVFGAKRIREDVYVIYFPTYLPVWRFWKTTPEHRQCKILKLEQKLKEWKETAAKHEREWKAAAAAKHAKQISTKC